MHDNISLLGLQLVGHYLLEPGTHNLYYGDEDKFTLGENKCQTPDVLIIGQMTLTQQMPLILCLGIGSS